MSFAQEWASWRTPRAVDVAAVPNVGEPAPTTQKLSFPDEKGRPTILLFLRHCGCPFAEKAFLSLRDLASSNPEIHCIAISHSTPSSTQTWLSSLPGDGAGPLTLIVDDSRTLYGKWGLGTSNWSHILKPSALMNLVKMGREEGIWNRPTESGSRWQTAGAFAVDGTGKVRWVHVMADTSDVPDVKNGLEALK